MAIERVSETTAAVYGELLDQLRGAVPIPQSGSFVSKVIGGNRYWYVQHAGGGRRRQIYLGLETPELLASLERADEARRSMSEESARRRELVLMLVAGGMASESAAVTSVLGLLADAALFRTGAVLVGTQAFRCIANLFGVRFKGENLRTADVDVAQGPISVAIGEMQTDLLDELRASDPRFVAVPELDPRNPSTSFRVRGRDLRVDLLAPGTRDGAKPVFIRHLNAAARPLPGLGYLLAETTLAAVVSGAGLLVTVPDPTAFAFHKLWVAERRNPSEQLKARKDRRQATQLLEVLLSDRPTDLGKAWRRLPAAMKTVVRRALAAFEPELRRDIAAQIQAAALSRR